MNKKKILGIAASLRNARWGAGSEELIEALTNINSKDELMDYLKKESELHIENFVRAGREQGKDFLEIHANLKKLKGNAGLSNSEVALAAALRAAKEECVDIDHVSLSEFFTTGNKIRNAEKLRQKLIESDGILIAGPVYFGDRGSLVESLFDFISLDEALSEKLKGKVYAGISVGAKRNGGQETYLIYQMCDMLDMGFLAVGNDSATTSQYGGTCHAGDIGTMHKDHYGLFTSMGTGRRLAHVVTYMNSEFLLKDKPRCLFLILQDDKSESAEKYVNKLIESHCHDVDATIVNVVKDRIRRCIACDICPTHIDLDEEYRCIITSKTDDFSELHKKLLDFDWIVPVVVIRNKKQLVNSKYQLFMERSRYLRRGDYVFSNLLVTPMIIKDYDVRESLSYGYLQIDDYL
jgi:multimeric flavodoxin WrbA